MTTTDHATVHGSPGEGARMAGLARAVFPLLVALFCLGYVAGAASGAALRGWHAGVILLLAGVVLLLGTASSARRMAAFFKGAAGEELVARELAHLPAGYHVFHSLDMGGGLLMWGRRGDMDHVVVGPTGVFVIETKNWRGKVSLVAGRLMVDGMAPRRAPLEQVRQAVSALQVRLGRGGIYDAAVVPVVCFTGTSLDAASQTVDETIVCQIAALLDLLTNAKRGSSSRTVDVAGVVQALTAGRA